MKKNWRVGFITNENPYDRRIWSGITVFVFNALQKEFDEVVPLGPFLPRTFVLKAINSVSNKILSNLHRFTQRIWKNKYAQQFSLLHSFVSSVYFKKQLKENGHFDLLVVPASHFSISFLQTKIPIVLITDATFYLLKDYYPDLTNLSFLSQQEFFATEKLAFKKARYTIFSSEWAANSAIKDYNIPSDNTRIIPFGANLEREPIREDVMMMRRQFSYKLLFIGVDWIRKGGQIAVECLNSLRNMGIDAHLIVCGCMPPESVDTTYITVIKYLDKNNLKDYEHFNELLKESDFLLLPTRADCTPIAFCEAAAYGLPVITTDTGAIPSVVDAGKTGFLLPIDALGADYAKVIGAIYSQKELYTKLVINARDKYEKELNWGAWASVFKSVIENGIK